MFLVPRRINLSKPLFRNSISEMLRRSPYFLGGKTFGWGVTYSVFHLVGYFPDKIDFVKMSITGLARKGRYSFTTAVGKSCATEEVFLVACRVSNISSSVGKQGTSLTKLAPGGTRLRSEGLTGVKSLLIFAK